MSLIKLPKNMPPGVMAIYFVQLFSTCSFAVLYASLVLYMRHTLHMSVDAATTLTGVYFAYNFGLHLLSGYMGGRFFSYRALIGIGIVFQLIGCLLLAQPTMQSLYMGLTGMLVGTGTMVTCINMCLSERFKADDPRREVAFFWNYSGMNIGFMIGFLFVGFFQLSANYADLFIVSAAINLIAGFVLLLSWPKMKNHHSFFASRTRGEQKRGNLIGVGVLFVLVIALYNLLQHSKISAYLVLVVGALMYLFVFVQVMKHRGKERKSLFAFMLLLVAALMFFVIYQLAPMGVMLFVQNNVDRHILGGVITPGWVSNINSLTIIIGAPLLASFFAFLRRSGKRLTVAHQFMFGLTLSALGLFILPLGIHFANHLGLVAFGWMAMYCILQALAELCITPVGYTMVGLLVPKRLQSVLMGTVLLNTGVAAILAGYFSAFAASNGASDKPVITNPGYSHAFTTLGLTTLGFAVALFMLMPFLKRWIKAPSA